MIAIDVMGGDFAPHVVLEGAIQAAKEGIGVSLFGPEEHLVELLDASCSDWKNLPIKFCNTSQVISMADEPVAAVRKKADASLVKAVQSVAAGDCAAVVSAGNSGALMVAGIFIIGRQDGIERPAFAGIFPTPHGRVIGLDLGANADCNVSNLLQFAYLGKAFAARVFEPSCELRVALLSNGEEDSKGSLLTKEAFQLFKAESQLNFVGNREPHHIITGSTDIFVCDGFTGNVFLKTFEAMIVQIQGLVKKSFMGIDKSPEINDIASRIEAQVFASYKSEELGGALLLGLKKPVFVCHGAAQAGDIAQAIRMAATYVKTAKND